MVTDAELRDAADAAFRKTTISYPQWLKNVAAGKYPASGPPSQWGIAFQNLEQIAAAPIPTPPPPSGGLLLFRPPTMSYPPVTVNVPSGPQTLTLDDSKDYLLNLGAVSWNTVGAGRTTTTRSELVIKGGRKRVIIGGSINVNSVDAWDDAVSLHLVGGVDADQGGEFYLEGVDFPNSVNAITLSTPSLVTLQNIRVGNNGVYQHDHSHGIHPDIIQVWRSTTGNGPRIRIDRFTGNSDYTGFSCLEAPDPRSWEIHHSNVQTVGDCIYAASGGQPHTACKYVWDEVWFHTAAGKIDDHISYTDSNWYRLSNGTQTWDSGGLRVGGAGSLTSLGGNQGDTWTCLEPTAGLYNQTAWWGTPPAGDFVPAGVPGVNYSSPGYA